MDISAALIALERGMKVTRRAWKDSGAVLKLHKAAPEANLQTDMIYLNLPHDQVTLWEVKQEDLFAGDWMIHVVRIGEQP